MEWGDSIIVDVTETVTSWVNRESENFGFGLKAEEAEGEASMVEFATREVPYRTTITDEDTTILDLRPALRISYVDTAGEDQRAVSIASQDVFAATLVSPFPPDTLAMLCGSGFPSRAFVRFDLSEVPDGSTVTKSIISLTVDPAKSSFDSMGVICHGITDENWSGFDTPIGASGTGLVTIKIDEIATDSTLRMDITPLIQPLVAGREKNRGLVIKTPVETFDLDFVGFFSSSSPDSAVLPLLEIDSLVPPTPPYSEEPRP
jgi:hypothetical protein